jgi:hypothetical protein
MMVPSNTHLILLVQNFSYYFCFCIGNPFCCRIAFVFQRFCLGSSLINWCFFLTPHSLLLFLQVV